ncbi:MAG: hypothetical protein IKH57_17865 [Clostridia bacterium]|nr:hypothetical protein [Clostridia bacterium]
MIEELFQKSYWVIDFLPQQVPEDSAGQFFAVERFYLQEPRQTALRRSFAEILLKVNCYYDIQACEPEEERWEHNPAPELLYSWIAESKKDLCILLPKESTLFTLNRDDLCMAVYHPSERLLKLLDWLAASAGLFLWQPPQEEKP